MAAHAVKLQRNLLECFRRGVLSLFEDVVSGGRLYVVKVGKVDVKVERGGQ